MSQSDRDAIRHTIGHLAGLVIKAAGADANSVTAELKDKPDAERVAGQQDASEMRDTVRAGFNLLSGFMCDVNTIADSLVTLAGPPVPDLAEAEIWRDAEGRGWRVIAQTATPGGKTWGLVVDPGDADDVSIMERPGS